MPDGKMPKNTILIVDDTPENLKVLLTFLKKCGFGIMVAQNGEDALKNLQKIQPDIILLDVLMPGMDGFAICQQLKQNNVTRDIPVIFMTALTESVDKVKGFAVGGVDYITKPLQHEEVLARVNTHLQLRKMQKDLEELNATKDKFFSIIAHDLKNPFTGLVSLSEFLLKSIDEIERDELIDCLQGMHTTSKQACNLLENLLQWARSQTGHIKCTPGRIEVKKLVERNVDLFKKIALEKNIAICCDIKDTPSVYADGDMLNTIMRNLLSNAIKYTHAKGLITIDAKTKEGFVEFTIADNGIGIRSQDIAKLFKIDISFSTLGTAREQGTGLGLILCREFVERNGGKIWVESTFGKGSNFKFTLKKG